MFKVDYAGTNGSRVQLMKSSQHCFDDDCDYTSTLTSSLLSAEDMGSYEAFSKCDLWLKSVEDDCWDESISGDNTKMTKSSSMPNRSPSSVFLPDPFPELTKSEFAPFLARIYRLEESSPSADKSDESLAPCRQRRDSLTSSSSNAKSLPSSQRVLLNFYTDEHNCNEVSLDGDTTAAQICYELVQCNHAIHSPQWTLVESIGRYRLERGIEHHETVWNIYNLWSEDEHCRFLFRKDFSKYELFKNPVQFFPENMVDCKMVDREDGWLTRSERYKNLLLQNLLANQSIPDIQGFLHIRDRDKRSWKKHYCVLRGTGLYYSIKGIQKEPQYLALISTLEDVNIYTSHNTKKVFGAPTSFGICLKMANCSSDPKQFQLFSCEDEQSRLCWLTGMRFVKYGAQLRDNFRLSLRCNEENEKSNAASTDKQSNNALYAKSRVPMDFSGDRGHVVTDPNEALAIAFEEAYNWRKKAVTRNTARQVQSTSGSDLLVDQAATMSSRQYPMHVANTIHLMQPWFHGNINREETVSLITEQGLVDGVFLIRNSQSIQNVFVLSFAHNHKVKHCTINKIAEGDGQLCFSLDGGTTKFMDLIQLVDFYQLNAGALPTQLKYHVTRL